MAWLVAPVLLGIGCRESLSGFGAGLRARASADQLFGAFADRFVEISRTPRYESSRRAITRGALSPSRVFDDSTVWTGSSGPVRLVEANGAYLDGKYVMDARRGAAAPVKPADARHVTTLSRLAEDQFRWDTSVDFALGNVGADEVALVISRLVAAAEGLNEREVRADILKSAPRSSAILGTLFTIDTLRPVALPDGSTAVTLGISLHSENLKAQYPALSDYVHRYLDPARFRFLLFDRSGAPFLDAQAKDRVITVRLRTDGGHLVPLMGPPRPMPDSMMVLADFTVKVKVFTVGFHDLSIQFINSANSDAERTWSFTAQKEPKWDLPFVTARLLRTPLRYPFAGEGALFRIGVREGSAGQPTVLVRQARLNVHESAVLRFLNSLSNTAMDDFGARVELEEAQFLRSLFLAMRDDARGVLAP